MALYQAFSLREKAWLREASIEAARGVLCNRSIAQCSYCAFIAPAQVAERQGRYLAKALSHKPSADSPKPAPFVFKPWGMLAYVGGYQALHDTPYDKSHGERFFACVIACSCMCII